MPTANRPNFIFILADDLGYADLGCTGAHQLTNVPISPHLDQLALDGMRFTDGYSNSAVCSPTRFALATGRYQYRIRAAAEEPLSSATARGHEGMGLDPKHPTVASLLRDAGYATALFGKWHLGYPPHFSPLKSGYETFFGALSGGIDYFTHADPAGRHDLHQSVSGDIEPVHSDVYFTDLISEQAVQFVAQQSAAKPFCMNLHYTAPHWPWETREDRAESQRLVAEQRKIFHVDGGSLATYRKMVLQMDEGIGLVLAALDKAGLADNTLVVFTSDNGGERFSDVWPFVGGKMDLMEGGIRVPLLARWPARIAPGQLNTTPAITMDWSATMLDAAGVPAQTDYPLDGHSLLPLFEAQPQSTELEARPLFWRMTHRAQRAMRLGPWKYLQVDGNQYLFNLDQDQHERANLATRFPERLAAMRVEWEAWAATMPAIPPEAKASLVFSEKEIPKATH